MPHQRFPKIEITYLRPHEMHFVLSETDVSVANTLRRIMIAEVPTIAIDLVEFSLNNTKLQDEYLAHRLGLIPIRYTGPPSAEGAGGASAGEARGVDPVGTFVDHRECTCTDRCNRCSVEFSLDVNYEEEMEAAGVTQGDGEDAGGLADRTLPLTVTSQKLISNHEHVSPAHFMSVEENDVSHDEGVSIVKIGPGQALRLHAIARIGISKEHAKWCPVAVATYRFWPIVTLDQEQISTLSIKQRQQLVDICPDRILTIDEATGEVGVAENFHEIATFTEDLEVFQKTLKRRPEDPDFVTVVPADDVFLFYLESTGCMDAQEILTSALRVLRSKLFTLSQNVYDLKDM
mmetsp:Transcript_1996/g.4333  ORF Transcript_1996/g.4333 Transcript_1996/m.4333 type:complete len:347 (+) Transcript_1996:150-1190(+)